MKSQQEKGLVVNNTAMGRPKIEIDFKGLKKLCNIQCTLVEISQWFNCSEDTVERRVKEKYDITFAEYYKKNSARGKMSLRRKQMQVALKGNVTMLIWLGKQHLGQTDKTEIDKKHKISMEDIDDLLD